MQRRPLVSVYSYDTNNLGDEIQSIAAARLVGEPDYVVPRDRSWLAARRLPSILIANGWYIHNPWSLMLPENLHPLYIAVHLNNPRLLTPRVVEYWKRHAPIGCRDHATLDLLKSKGIEAYFSGCLTPTLTPGGAPRTDEVVIADVEADLLPSIPAALREQATYVTHTWTGPADPPSSAPPQANGPSRSSASPSSLRRAHLSSVPYFYSQSDLVFGAVSLAQRMLNRKDTSGANTVRNARAKALLEKYATARLVITSRLHCALPCLGLGTPVLFLRGSKGDPRFGGYADLLPIQDPRTEDIDWSPPAREVSGYRERVVRAFRERFEEVRRRLERA
ncbi:MAG: polysaccharide pyruvyl transferase family protein [Deltaproteobacteria bacterium]|nr:polysaccharide pyruvyl transferase family protein [Deltaproteobacteria bacterium]